MDYFLLNLLAKLLLSIAIVLIIFIRYFGCRQAPRQTKQKFFDNLKIGGHRGAPNLGPENTLESFTKAIDSNVDLLEFDLALTKDKVAVLMHDSNLLRTCGEDKDISTLTFNELKNINAGKTFYASRKEMGFQKIPTLKETVELCSSKKIKMIFDVKDSSKEMVSEIVQIISKNNLYDQIIVSSFFPWISYAIKKADPNILTGITWRPNFFSHKDLDCTINRFSGFMHYLAVLFDYLITLLIWDQLPRFLGVEMLLLIERNVNRAIVDEMRKKEINVFAWTINNKSEAIYFLNDLQVPFLTDEPEKINNDLNDLKI